MILNIRHVPFKTDVERYNKVKLAKSKSRLFQRVVEVIGLKNAKIIYDALLHNVNILKTNDIDLIYNSEKINRHFGLRIVNNET